MGNNKRSIGVIVIGDHAQALGVIRSLSRHGIPIYLFHEEMKINEHGRLY